MGSNIKEREPKNSIDRILEVQTIQPRAKPTSESIPKTSNIPIIAVG
jgi:hypothetical protein